VTVQQRVLYWKEKTLPYVLGWTTRIQFPVGAMMGFSTFSTTSRLAVGPTQPPYPMGTGSCYPIVEVVRV